MPNRSLDEWLALLESRHPRAIELGLDRITRVMARMQESRPAPLVVTVGGTNGKGSTVAFIDALLRASGRRTGTYTSPHLIHFRERIRIQGEAVTDDMLCAAFGRVEAACADVSLTYFEFTTLAAFDLLARAQLDVAVLEVGLGGRLDAVNAVDADVAVVTRIAFDHSDWLGDTLDSIAGEKAGIFRPGKAAIVGQADAPAVLRECASQCGAVWLGRGDAFQVTDSGQGWDWAGCNARGESLCLAGLPEPLLPRDSAATALQVLAWLGALPPEPQIRQVLATLSVPGRWQQVESGGIRFILDVAHNPDAAAWLAARLAGERFTGRTLAVYAAMADKDIPGMLAQMMPLVDAWLLAELPDVPRACPVAELAAAVERAGSHMVSVSKNVRQALARARQLAGPDDRVVVWGSFYTVGKVLALLQK